MNEDTINVTEAEAESNSNRDLSCMPEKPICQEYQYNRSTSSPNDIFAMQGVICVGIIACFMLANLAFPELCEALLNKFKALTTEENEVIPNLIDLLKSL